MENSRHYTFFTIFDGVCHSFMKHGTQNVQYIMNCNFADVFSICRSLLYVNNIFVVDKLSHTCFQSHTGCRLTINTIIMSFSANYVCVNMMFFLEGPKYKGSSMAIRSSCGCQYWLGQSGTTTTGYCSSSVHVIRNRKIVWKVVWIDYYLRLNLSSRRY